MASGSLSLEGICAICNPFTTVSRALAEEHSVALIIGSDGTLSFTSMASQAISEASHPLHKVIARACHQHHEKTGEDCKSVLALLDHILGLASSLAKDIGDVPARQILLAELSNFEVSLPKLFQKIRDAVGVVSLTDDPVFFGQRLFDVLHGRSAAGIVDQFIRSSVSDPSATLDALDYFVGCFEDLCLRGEESMVVKGFLFRARTNTLQSALKQKFIVVWDVSFKTDDVVWVGDAVQLSRVWSKVETILKGLKDRGVSMICTPSAAPSRLHSFCSHLGISLVDRLSSGDLQNILFFTGITPLDTLNNTPEVNCISCIDSVRLVVIGSTQFINLETSVTKPFLPCHVVLSAPSDSVWKERYSEFMDCLKILRCWLRPLGFESLHATKSNPSPSKKLSGISFPLGLWQFEFKLALQSANRSYPNLCRLLDCALLAMVCCTWGIPVCRYKGRDSYEEYAQRNVIKRLVPAANVEAEFLETLQLFRQLLRIDALFGSKELTGFMQADQCG